MTNAVETAATMYTINSIVALLIVAGIVGYLVTGTVLAALEERKFRSKFNRLRNKVLK